MLPAMRKLAASTTLALLIAVPSVALADIAPRKREVRVVEPSHAPEMEPAPEDAAPSDTEAEAEPPPKKEKRKLYEVPEDDAPPPADPPPPAENKPEKKADAKAEKASETSGSCSVVPEEDALFGLAALVLLISGFALRRRS
jgi:hypothetical protein